MDAITMVTLSTLLWKLVAFTKNLFNKPSGSKAYLDPIVTQLLAWVFGFLVVLIAAQANVASSLKVWGTTLDKLNGGSLLLLGLAISSFGGAAVEVKKALDKSDSAAQPSLLTGDRPDR